MYFAIAQAEVILQINLSTAVSSSSRSSSSSSSGNSGSSGSTGCSGCGGNSKSGTIKKML